MSEEERRPEQARAIEPPEGGPDNTVLPMMTELPVETRLWRVHPAFYPSEDGESLITNDGTLFNPGLGSPTRFAPLTALDGNVVPTLYVGETQRAALFETVLHDQMPGSVVDGRDWRLHLLTPLRLARPLRLVQLHGVGLRMLGLQPADLTHTFPSAYPRTTRWAAWLHAHAPDAQGLIWNSHQDDDQRALVLFGDRVGLGTVVAETPSVEIGNGPGLDWMLGHAASIRVQIIGLT